jgi:6-phosphogluconate dehydrogenase
VKKGESEMAEAKCDIGLIGMGVMGRNLVLNMEDNGYSVGVYNRTTSKTKDFVHENKDREIYPGYSYEEFVGLLKRPRSIMLMVKAGSPVDAVIDDLVPLLDKGDLIIDGGNSYYKDTERRATDLEGKGFMYIGTGV